MLNTEGGSGSPPDETGLAEGALLAVKRTLYELGIIAAIGGLFALLRVVWR